MNPPLNLRGLTHRTLVSGKTGEVFSQSAVLSDLLGFQDLFIHHEILAPGHRASAPHAHSHQEEMILVLEGSPVAHEGDTSTPLQPGDVVGFHPGTQRLHYVENPSEKEVHLLVVGSKPKDDQVEFATDY